MLAADDGNPQTMAKMYEVRSRGTIRSDCRTAVTQMYDTMMRSCE